MCIKHLWPFRTPREKAKDCIDSCDDSSRKRRTSTLQEGASRGDSKENSSSSQPERRSLIEGKWLQVSAKNFEALYSALSVTTTDIELTRNLHLDPLVMTFRIVDSKGELWETVYESVQRGIIKNLLKVGEECDELTPHRQWVRSTMTIPNKYTINCLKKYKNGTQAHLILEVKPTSPDQLTITTYYDDVVSVLTAKRVEELNNCNHCE